MTYSYTLDRLVSGAELGRDTDGGPTTEIALKLENLLLKVANAAELQRKRENFVEIMEWRSLIRKTTYIPLTPKL